VYWANVGLPINKVRHSIKINLPNTIVLKYGQ